jgi:small-conductance mechanosensitive channel
MPWTFAHPAAILPLRSLCPRWLSLPGLVLGAMAPDLSYYVGLHGRYAGFCHTAPGIFTVCLPACLLVLALLLRFCRPLTVLLPEPHRDIVRGQLRQPARAPWVSLVVAVVSILLGTGTHVLWDSFTHPNLWGTSLLPWLNRPVFAALDRQFVVATLLQHLSTAAGVVALVAVYWRALDARRDTAPPPRDARRTFVLAACVAIAVAAGALSAHALTAAGQPGYASRLLVRTVVWSTSCFATLYVIASLAWWQRRGDA